MANELESVRATLTYSIATGLKPINEMLEGENLERTYTGLLIDPWLKSITVDQK